MPPTKRKREVEPASDSHSDAESASGSGSGSGSGSASGSGSGSGSASASGSGSAPASGSGSDPEAQSPKSNNKARVVRPLSARRLAAFTERARLRGVVRIPHVPPFMKPSALRRRLEAFGTIERIFLRPEDAATRQRRIRSGGNRRVCYTEGFAEYTDKRIAKRVALSLNGTPMGGKKGKRVGGAGRVLNCRCRGAEGVNVFCEKEVWAKKEKQKERKKNCESRNPKMRESFSLDSIFRPETMIFVLISHASMDECVLQVYVQPSAAHRNVSPMHANMTKLKPPNSKKKN
jgi:hypothetical protein